MAAISRPIALIDLSDPQLYKSGDPHTVWTEMRARQPVAWTEREGRPGFWSLTRHADIVRVSTDKENFTSTQGTSLGSDRQLHADGADSPPTQETGRMLLTTDPPEHTRLRKLVTQWFSPRTARALEPRVRTIAHELCDRIAERDEWDFVEEVAAILPLAVICEVMGIPRTDWQLIVDIGNRSIGADDPEYQTGDSAQTARAAALDSHRYFSALVADRRAASGDDIISRLACAEIDGERLSEADLVAFCLLLAVAGNETTRNTLSGGLLALREHPHERERLITDPSLMPTAVEEILRWVSPIKHFYRVALNDVEIRGQRIASGERVVLWYPSGNRDEDAFRQPFSFDLSREPNDHLAFGRGPHFCLGAFLARIELAVMFDELLRRFPDIEPIGPAPRLQSSFMSGIKRLPVRIRSRA